MNGRLIWPALLAVGTVAEVRSLRRHDGCTLSETYRAVARTDTPLGRALTVVGLTALFGWLTPHLCRAAGRVVEVVADAIDEVTP